jgi:hypothetical protein
MVELELERTGGDAPQALEQSAPLGAGDRAQEGQSGFSLLGWGDPSAGHPLPA